MLKYRGTNSEISQTPWGSGKRKDTFNGGPEIRRENQLRLVVEIPLFTRFRNIPGGCLGFLPSTVRIQSGFCTIYHLRWKPIKIKINGNSWSHKMIYKNAGFLKWWYPQIIHFNRVFHYKPSILGYPYFWKHPNRKTKKIRTETLLGSLLSRAFMFLLITFGSDNKNGGSVPKLKKRGIERRL